MSNAVPYEAPKEVKEQGEAGLKEVEKVAIRKGMTYTSPEKLATEPNKGMFQSRAWLNNNNWHYFTCDTKRECDKEAIEWMNDYRDLHPAPVASGLREDEIIGILNSAFLLDNQGYRCSMSHKECERLAREILSRHPSTPQAEKVDRTEELVAKMRAWKKSYDVFPSMAADKEFEETMAEYDKGAK